MAITAAQVKELRDRTGVAMMKCKKALSECDGDMEAAVDYLRKVAGATADKKSDRATDNGGLGLATSDGAGVLVMLSCETDFVSGNDTFKGFVQSVAEAALAAGCESLDDLGAVAMDGETVQDKLTEQIGRLGENMSFASFERVTADAVAGYNHGGRVATLVAGSGSAETLRSVAMHIAAANPAPIALDRDGVPSETVDKEREIIAASDEIQNKPEQIRPKIVEGKLNRFFKEYVLLEQEILVGGDGENVGAWAKANDIDISAFRRLSV